MTKHRPDDTETLRLVAAFYRVSDPNVRRTIVELAEAVANGKPITVEALRSLIAL
jgi:hypothetical protein